MRHLLATLFALFLAGSFALANAPQAALPATPEYETPVQLVTTMQGVPLNDALALLGASAGINLVTQDVPTKTVTYRFEDPAPFRELLTVILTLENLSVTEVGSTLIIQPAQATTQVSAQEEEAEEIKAEFYPVEHAADEIASILPTLHPGASAQVLAGGTRLLITAPESAHGDIATFITEYQATTATEELPTAFIPVRRGQADLLPLLSERFPDANIQNVESAKALSVTADEATIEAIRVYITEYEAFLDAREEAGAIASEEPIPTSERTYRISNTTASEIAATIQNVLANEASEEEAASVSFVPDDRTNKLIVRAPESLFERVEALIEELDEQTKQVRVTVRIQEISQREAENLGLSITGNAGALVTSIVNGAAQFAFNPGQAITALNIGAVLDTLEAQNLSRTLDNAVLVVANNGTASLNSGGNINVAVEMGEGENSTTQSESITFGTQVTVTPRITNDGRIDLTLTSTVSGFEGELDRLTGLRFSDKTIDTNVVVDDREVLVIGGLIQNSFTSSVQGVPILSAIPILGGLFTTETTENNRSELVVVVTAEILE